MRVDNADAVIVGGGVAALACAVALAENGVRAVALEREPRFGGRATSWVDRASGDTVDTPGRIAPHELLIVPPLSPGGEAHKWRLCRVESRNW